MRLNLKRKKRSELDDGYVLLVVNNFSRIVICKKNGEINHTVGKCFNVSEGVSFSLTKRNMKFYKESYCHNIILKHIENDTIDPSFNISENVFKLINKMNSSSDFLKIIGLIKEEININ